MLLIQIVKQRMLRMLGVYTDDDIGTQSVDNLGHRAYVGGLWEAIGRLQFRFMIERGLEPQHVFLDVACGSLRGGVRFIPYLEPGCYLGLDIKQELIDIGIKHESLFTHLTANHILLCLDNLREIAKTSTQFYVTFFEADRPVKNPKRSHPHAGFAYTRDQMTEFGAACGWATRYIGDWNHPRQQKILQYSVKL
jgi:hypothetical protein